MAVPGLQRRLDERVGLQGKPGKPVVATLPFGQTPRQDLFLQAVDPPYPGPERRAREVVGTQTAAPLPQGVNMGVAAAAERRDCGEGRDPDRGDAAGPREPPAGGAGSGW